MITTRTERAPRLYTVSVNKISHEVAFAWRELMRRKAALYVRNPPTLAEEPINFYHPWQDVDMNAMEISTSVLKERFSIEEVDIMGNPIDISRDDLYEYIKKRTEVGLLFYRRMLPEVRKHSKDPGMRREFGNPLDYFSITEGEKRKSAVTYSHLPLIDISKINVGPIAKKAIMQWDLALKTDTKRAIDPDEAQEAFDVPWAA